MNQIDLFKYIDGKFYLQRTEVPSSSIAVFLDLPETTTPEEVGKALLERQSIERARDALKRSKNELIGKFYNNELIRVASPNSTVYVNENSQLQRYQDEMFKYDSDIQKLLKSFVIYTQRLLFNPLLRAGEQKDRFGNKVFNVKTSMPIDRIKYKEPVRILQFLDHLFKPDSRDMFLLWLSTVVFRSKPEFSIVLLGAKGIGKSTLTQIIQSMIGGELTGYATKDSLGAFNDDLIGRLLIVFEEAEIDKDTYTKIKAFMNESIRINPKGKPSYSAENFSSWLLLSNNATDIHIEPDDRRLYVSELNKNTLEEHLDGLDYHEWKKEIMSEARGFYDYLRSFGEDKKLPGTPPMTEDKKMIIDSTKPEWIKIIENRVRKYGRISLQETLADNEARPYFRKVKSGEVYDSFKFSREFKVSRKVTESGIEDIIIWKENQDAKLA